MTKFTKHKELAKHLDNLCQACYCDTHFIYHPESCPLNKNKNKKKCKDISLQEWEQYIIEVFEDFKDFEVFEDIASEYNWMD